MSFFSNKIMMEKFVKSFSFINKWKSALSIETRLGIGVHFAIIWWMNYAVYRYQF